MNEFLSTSNPEQERTQGLAQLVGEYFPGDVEFVAGLDEEETIGFVYGQLLELGEDPNEVLHEFGVIERDDEV